MDLPQHEAADDDGLFIAEQELSGLGLEQIGAFVESVGLFQQTRQFKVQPSGIDGPDRLAELGDDDELIFQARIG
jgi:hypothetical protein